MSTTASTPTTLPRCSAFDEHSVVFARRCVRWSSLVGAGGPAPCRLALPDRVCIRPSLCLKRVPRFKQKRPACGGFQYCQRGGWPSLVEGVPKCTFCLYPRRCVRMAKMQGAEVVGAGGVLRDLPTPHSGRTAAHRRGWHRALPLGAPRPCLHPPFSLLEARSALQAKATRLRRKSVAPVHFLKFEILRLCRLLILLVK